MGSLVVSILSLFPVGAVVALIFWFVYVGKYANDGPDSANDAKGKTNQDKYTIAYQAVVATVLLYLMLHNHTKLLMGGL